MGYQDGSILLSIVGDIGGGRWSLSTFELVSFDKFRKPQPLPAGLGDQPLYRTDNGFYSVTGPLDLPVLPPCRAVVCVNGDNHSTIHPSAADISGHSDQNPSLQYLNDHVASRGPQTHPERKSYLCGKPGCTWKSSFPTKQGLDRHREVKHLNIRVDCPIPGCERVGDKGIKRKDNLPAHVLNKHGIELPRQSLRDLA
ncbi:hypothetical protein HOY80DRAFT_1138016 [Tuber brumale]|nr:hypothetical protein HOY80DRAFT_1138016 [Tuber brumale]